MRLFIRLFYVQCTVTYITGVMKLLYLLKIDIFAQYILLVCLAGMSRHNTELVIYPIMMTKMKYFVAFLLLN